MPEPSQPPAKRRSGGTFTATTRAASPVVGKALEAGIVILYIGLLTTTLYAGAIPEYRSAAAQEVADRTLADASAELRAAIPHNATAVNATTRLELPRTIGSSAYTIRVTSGRLVLEHPHPSVGGKTPLALPESVETVDGHWDSQESANVRVRDSPNGLVVRLGGEGS
ncbi:hypothetical protein SAMN06269185_1843 [Natronoarchaeum philippinense]|uniref:Uncharacterized protein n=1 Tax=Natronoarchaeum philippinense TaxID=558529 RepID=A0A285NUN6_NATPI|nr:hypothetical protein [Natronoarchaeum philippinense]SNZ12633.1 hypothetical protein SAMN06269185_1843 [Natronoarchaeum philippinense]